MLATVDRALRRAPASITLIGLLLLVAAVAGVWTPLDAVAGAVVVAVILPTTALATPALVLRRPGVVPRLFALGTLATGASAGMLPLVAASVRAPLVAVGLGLSTVAYVAGLLCLPGVAAGWPDRWRLGLDGLVTGASLVLAGWLFAPQPGDPAGYGVVGLAAGAVVVMGIVLWRTTVPWPAAAACVGGVGFGVLGLAAVTLAVVGVAPVGVLLTGATLIVLAPPLLWAGAEWAGVGRRGPERAGGPVDGAADRPARPLHPAAVACGLTAMVYHLATADRPDRIGLLAGTGVVTALLVRQAVGLHQRRRAVQRLTSQATGLAALVSGVSDAVLTLDAELRVGGIPPRSDRPVLLGTEVVGRRFTDLLHPDDVAATVDRLRAITGDPVPGRRVTVEARLRGRHGGWLDTECTVTDLRADPAVAALVVQVRQVSHGQAAEHSAHRFIGRDELTGLPTRRDLVRAITARLHAGHRTGVLLVVELPGMCELNDRHGRAAGDHVLVAAAERLTSQVGRADLVARLGERTLAVVTGEGPVEAYALGFRLLAELDQPYRLPTGPVRARASVGLATLSGGRDAEEVLRHGELAVRQAAALDTTRIDWYDESLEQHLVRRLDLERHLPGAAGRAELDLIFQPVLDLVSGEPVGVEALLRWRHPVLGTVLPSEVLPVADRLGLADEIGQWVLHAASRQVARWRRDGHDLWLSINVSVSQLTAPDFVAEVAAALSVHECPPERLLVEISEQEVGDHLSAVAAQLSKLRALGARTGLDDFGAGSMDLTGLRRLPLDVVKLAGSVTRAFTATPGGPSDGLPEAMLAMARRFHLTPVAVGIETPAQRERIRAAGCRLGQGFQLAPPAPSAQVTAFLARAGLDGQLAQPGQG